MYVDFTTDQRALKNHSRRVLDKVAAGSARRVLEEAGASHDKALWATLGEQGWHGVAIPRQHGGLGLGYVELCVLAEELGRAVAPVPFATTIYLFAEALLIGGSEMHRADFLPRISAGSLIGTIAISEGPGEAAPKARVVDGRLTGVKLPVLDAMVADAAIVLTTAEGAPQLWLVDLNGPGIVREPVSSLDPTRQMGRLTFDGAPAASIGGPDLWRRLQTRAAVPLAFEALGGADRCLEMAVDYATQRHSFGRPIGSYQAIKHKLADMYVKNEVARSTAYYAAWALANDAPELPAAAATARLAACDAYWFAAKEAIQVHGGIGFTWEMDCQLFYRRSRLLATMIGSPATWRAQLAEMLVTGAGA